MCLCPVGDQLIRLTTFFLPPLLHLWSFQKTERPLFGQLVDAVIYINQCNSIYIYTDNCFSYTGQRFPTKSLEVSLQATVHFPNNPVLSDDDDPFCTGLNAYIDVRLLLGLDGPTV